MTSAPHSGPVKRVALNGAEFAYQIAGTGNRPTIVVLHGGRGIGDHRDDFAAFAPLADRYRILAYDMRGCGTSSLTPPYTFDTFADDLEAIRAHFCGEDPMILLGGSFGGMIALTYAARYPSGLSHLILRGTAPSYHHEEEAKVNFKQRLHKASSASPLMVDKMLSDAVIDDNELRLIWLALQPLYFEEFDPNAALEATRVKHFHAETHNALFAEKTYDLRETLPRMTTPTLVVVGGNDWICPPSQSRLIAERMPNAELFEVEGANHPVHVEASDRVISRIRSFIAEGTSP